MDERYIPVSSLKNESVVTTEKRGLVVPMLKVTLGRKEKAERAGLALGSSRGRSAEMLLTEMVTAAQ